MKAYLAAFAALAGLTCLTVFVAGVDLGAALNDLAAFGIAGVKASIVIWVFMHVRRSERVIRLFPIAGLLWVLILAGLIYADVAKREQVQPRGGYSTVSLSEP